MANEAENDPGFHLGRERLQRFNQRSGIGCRVERADVGYDDFAVGTRSCRWGGADNPCRIVTVGNEVELLCGFLRIPDAHHFARSFIHGNNSGCICDGTGFSLRPQNRGHVHCG